MRVERETVINAPREVVWEHITDPGNYMTFFSGITRWDVEGRKRRGLGARYRILMRVGSAEVGGLVEVVEYEDPGDMAWTSVLGLDQRGRWRLREHGANRTLVMFRMSYQAPGGLLGWLADQVSAPTVRGYVRHTLENLKRHVETEQAERSRAKRPKPAKRQATRA
jgi:uncharacterized membrane protein